MAAVESFAMSKPIIASNLGGLVEMVNKENNGFLFEPRNYDSLKETVIKANNISDENYFRLSNNAFKFASENFNSENYYNKLISIYNSVLEN
jgi:glycosyltransferase involved in cell wall biosynthesis